MVDAIIRAIFGSDGFWVFLALFIIGYWLWYSFGGGEEKYIKRHQERWKKMDEERKKFENTGR